MRGSEDRKKNTTKDTVATPSQARARPAGLPLKVLCRGLRLLRGKEAGSLCVNSRNCTIWGGSAGAKCPACKAPVWIEDLGACLLGCGLCRRRRGFGSSHEALPVRAFDNIASYLSAILIPHLICRCQTICAYQVSIISGWNFPLPCGRLSIHVCCCPHGSRTAVNLSFIYSRNVAWGSAPSWSPTYSCVVSICTIDAGLFSGCCIRQ